MITNIEDYFTKGCDRCVKFNTPECATQIWAKGLAGLRTICLDAGLDETVKWGHPCYMHAGRNIAILGAFRENFRLSFMNGSLLKNTQKVLEKNGPNTENATIMRFTDNDEVAQKALIIRAYLYELMGYASAGIKPTPKHQTELDLVVELEIALEDDIMLAEAFDALKPGRKRGWNLHFSSAKQFVTRERRIAAAHLQIIAGKGWNER